MNRSLWNKYRRLINFHTVLCWLGKTQFLLLWLPEQSLPTPGLASFGCEEVWTDTGINNVYLSPDLKLCRVPFNKFCSSYRIQAGRWAWVHNPRHCGCIFYLLQLSRTRVLAAHRHIPSTPTSSSSHATVTTSHHFSCLCAFACGSHSFASSLGWSCFMLISTPPSTFS